ncbi:[protein-PII] uridylyltransferase [Methylomicrobium agile]|uniref:[protein-PII] uridylyltransferase n=1 Tax=Methylomicrobium agile TaxID=39774 RepID=UPI0004DF3318|nr:[protein-PII] uridylyltransferase [Methylomicrobium agile]
MHDPIDKLPFSGSDSLPFFKQLLKEKNAELHRQFDPHRSVLPLLHAKSDFIDAILGRCWRLFLGDHAPRLSLIAVGGYGRRELFPYSDIDIMVLLDSEGAAPRQDALVQFFTFLWDIGLKPGYSVRTVEECVREAIDDQTVITSLMEMRLICGDQALYETLREAIAPDKIWPSDQFFAAKMKEQRQRYAKFHDTAYNLEPNIKEGPGGLRDRQVIAWVFKRHYNSSTLKELIKYGFLPVSEYNELVDAVEVLWRIRYALHLQTNRCEDRLIFDYQRELAAQFGFSREDQQYNQDVELFMQFYFKTVQGLERLNEMLLQLFHERFINGHTDIKPIPDNAQFVSINGYLEAVDEQAFIRNPASLLEMILILQQHPELKGVRATTIRLVRKSLHLIDDDFRHDKTANRLFVKIFQQPRGLTHQLRRMNRYGILAAYLPGFANIVARMQYDLFHIYTVDEHTLFVIRNLRRFSLEKHKDELPLCNQIFLLIGKPELLYFAALFHDIAKGMNGDHSTIGENIAREFCRQHDFSAHDTKLVAWLVRNHLIMSMTAQRKDISDPDVIYKFAQQAASVEYLNHLYLLTVADIRATNPELWNSWKDSLLRELYSATHLMLRRGLPNPAGQTDRILETKKEAYDELLKLGLSKADIDASWRHVNDDYFLRYSADEIVWHTIAIASSSEAELPLVLLRPQTQHGSAEVFVYTTNEGNIFSISTATLDQLGLTVLDARIMTTLDNYVLNSFQVLEQNGEPITDLLREVHICSVLRNNLLNKAVHERKNIHRQSRQAKHFPIPTSIRFQDDPLSHCTIIELITTDRAGLLSKIGRAFLKQHINLHNAKITTIGSRAEDMFYVTDSALRPITDAETQKKLREEIVSALGG